VQTSESPVVGDQKPRRERLTALIADDDRSTLAILQATLRQEGIEVVSARDGANAWEQLRRQPGISLAIVDWMMPGIDGLELCRRMRQDPLLSNVYVILLTARHERGDIVSGLGAGADDYIVKPFDVQELKARVRVGVRLASLQERLAAKIAELEVARDELERLASTDALTELCSRRRWYEAAGDEIARFRRHRRPFSILVADLDFFKRVNDTFGHAAGDDVLKTFAKLLRTATRTTDVLGRIGGEEFAALFPETALDSTEAVAERIVNACGSVRAISGSASIDFTCSIGITEAVADDDSIEIMLRRADAALYEAKRGGRNQVVAVRG
jgi:two-component system, cell cycle response regulator